MIDAHAHLDDRRFAHDLGVVLERASVAGVVRVLSCGEDLASTERTLAVARDHSSVRVAAGVHPHRAGSWSDDVTERLTALAKDDRVVAIGEIGVDLSGRSAPRDVQERAFAAQLALARDLDLPVVVHIRDAGPLAREIVDRVPGVRGMIHCYSEGPAEVAQWTRRGFVLSFAGTVTYPKNLPLRAAAAMCPRDRILVEPDAPSPAPQRPRGHRNEPAFVAEILAAVAAARSEAVADLAQAMSVTAAGLFGARWG